MYKSKNQQSNEQPEYEECLSVSSWSRSRKERDYSTKKNGLLTENPFISHLISRCYDAVINKEFIVAEEVPLGDDKGLKNYLNLRKIY